MAKQRSKFPNDPNMHTIALTVISAIPWAMGREQLLAFSDDLFMFFYGLLHYTVQNQGYLYTPSSSKWEKLATKILKICLPRQSDVIGLILT